MLNMMILLLATSQHVGYTNQNIGYGTINILYCPNVLFTIIFVTEIAML